MPNFRRESGFFLPNHVADAYHEVVRVASTGGRRYGLARHLLERPDVRRMQT